jgi:hypothetical protein
MKFYFLIVIFLITVLSVKSQVTKIDSIYGSIKRIREKVINLDNLDNLDEGTTEYSDSIILLPNSLNLNIYDSSFSGSASEYVNFERFYNENGSILKHIWLIKNDEFYKSITYKYDDKNRVISEIDSSRNNLTTDKHYYEDFDEYTNENIISINLDLNYFQHTIKQYKDNQIIRTKLIDDYGNITEFINNYNENGKLKYTTLKTPETWQKNENENWSYGVHDTIPNVFKSSVYEYDDKNRLLKRLDYDYSAKNNYEKPILLHQILYTYNDNKTTVKKIYESGMISSFIYVYDKKNRIIEYHCCSDNISDSKSVKKYTYKNDKIVSLQYITKDNNKTKIQNIDFKYKYDDKNNWIEIIKIIDGKEKSKRTREIEYY